jgi:hypothetical protein
VSKATEEKEKQMQMERDQEQAESRFWMKELYKSGQGNAINLNKPVFPAQLRAWHDRPHARDEVLVDRPQTKKL